ncbi:MAG TPA: hypothetical protein VHX49_07295 [Candidatus Acidoferrales bacterium]|jgi:hypothetical protein|nr:hypothetical protein [Candidatus Acidoferrales bacterium]
MRVIARLLLRAKHWQIFFFLVAVCVLDWRLAANSSSAEILTVLEFLTGAAWICLMGWFLDSIIQPSLRLKTRFFYFAVIYSSLYGYLESAFPGNDSSLVSVKILLSVVAPICAIYILRFVSKSLVTAETGKPASFYDYVGILLLNIWYFPIGVWVIQPRINDLYAQTMNGPISARSLRNGAVQLPD